MTPFEAFCAGFQAGIDVTLQAHREEIRKRVQRHRMKKKGVTLHDVYTSTSIGKEESKKVRKIDSGNVTPESFERFWLAYPRKQAKQDASEAFRAAIKRGVDAEMLIGAAAVYAAEMHKQGTELHYIKLAGGWIRKARYEDYQPKDNVMSPEEFRQKMKEYEERKQRKQREREEARKRRRPL